VPPTNPPSTSNAATFERPKTLAALKQEEQPHPHLLNEKFKVHSYDGGSFKSKSQYLLKNVLLPSNDPFHCSEPGTKYTAVFKCSNACTLTHIALSTPSKRCTEPLKSGLVWVLENPPNVHDYAEFDEIPLEELRKK
jgi:hypothetical protein